VEGGYAPLRCVALRLSSYVGGEYDWQNMAWLDNA
jgi:hypothetical protein